LEVAALSDILIVDEEEGLYDPNHYNDRLLLGLKGTPRLSHKKVLKFMNK
jgi:hypothetical protein